MKISLRICFAGLFAYAHSIANAADLSQLSLEDLLNVRITGASKYEQKRGEIAAAVSVISRNEIKAYGWRTLSEALSSLPGIYSTYDRQYSYLGTRGFGIPGDYNSRILLTINGNRLNDVAYDSALLGREFQMDLDLIEHIEYIPGPGGAVYGQNALFGVVNIVTRTGDAVDGTELAASYQGPQSAKEGRVTWGRKLENGLDVLLSASGYHSKGENNFFEYPGADAFSLPTSGVARDMDGERDKEVFAQLSKGAWSFDFSYGDRRKYDPTGSFLSDPLVSNQYQRDRSLQTQLQYQDSFAENTLQVTGRVFLGRERYTGNGFYGGLRYFSTGSSDWWGTELRLLATGWKHHKVMLGLEYQDNGRHDQSTENIAAPANSIIIPGSGYRYGIYVQDEWAMTDALSATLGLRMDHNSTEDETLSPRAGLIWQASAASTLKALYGRAHRAPNAYERDYVDGVAQIANTALQGEQIDTLELVLDQRLTPSFNLHGSVYHWKMQDVIKLVNVSPTASQFQNSDSVKAYGIEMGADKSWSDGSRMRASLSYQTTQDDSGDTLVNSPHLMGKLNISTPLPALGMLLGYELQSYSKRESIVRGTYVSGYALSNLNLTADKWIKNTELSLGIYNLFDKRYAQPAADTSWQNTLQQDDRQVRIKAIYKF